MADLVWNAILNNNHVLIEAGTGVGKSLAYLLPSMLWALITKKRAVISTHTLNLQSQLMLKDIPICNHILSPSGLRLKYDLFKGRSHYLCIRRLKRGAPEHARRTSLMVADRDDKAMDVLLDLTESKDWSGERETLPFHISNSLWSTVCSDSNRCMGMRCPFKEECFYRLKRKRLEECHIIVVNHALMASHIKVLHDSAGKNNLIPQFETLIIDEAHHFEECIRNSLCSEINHTLFKRLSDDTLKLASGPILAKHISQENVLQLKKSMEETQGILQGMLSQLDPIAASGKDKIRITRPGSMHPRLKENILDLTSQIGTWADFNLSEEERFETTSMGRRFHSLYLGLQAIDDLEDYDKGWVYWCENLDGRKGGRVSLKISPLEVGGFVEENLWSSLPCAVLTSATLSISKSLAHITRNLHIPQPIEKILGSSFNYEEQVRLCVPSDSLNLNPNSPRFREYVITKVLEIADLVQGRTFVLFTNKKLMEQVAGKLREPLEERGYPVLIQGESPRHLLLDEFKDSGKAVLFGLNSFWEGVDVPGDALSCVVLTRLPFPVPDDPVMEAREELWKSQHRSVFSDYSLPQAILKLKQGFGRLIRTKDDRGAVVILDSRLVTRSYGKLILKSLPKTRLVQDLGDIISTISTPKST